MKIINWLKNRSGKMALSLAQGIGAAAVVGVAGIAAYQMFSSPEVNPDTVFSSHDDDVVYVAGGSSGAYSGVGYGENGGGEVQSGIRVKKSRSMELMEQDALRMKEQPQTQLDRDEQEVQDFAMGKTTGLGMGQNEANEVNIGQNGDMSGINSQIAAISAMAEQQKKEAQEKAAGAGEGGDIARAAQAALGKGGSGKGWGNMNSSIARANGSNLNSESLQASGVPGSKRGGAGSKGKEADRLAMANTPVGFSSSRDEFINARRRYTGGDDLTAMAKQSASFKDGPHSTNEATTSVFMSSGTGVHALSIGDNAVSSLGATESDDFTGASIPSLGNYLDDAMNYAADKEKLTHTLEKTRVCINWASNWLPLVGAGLAYAICNSKYGTYKEIDKFDSKWGDSEQEKSNTKGKFADNAKTLTDRMYGGAIFWGGAEWAWQENKHFLYDEADTSK